MCYFCSSNYSDRERFPIFRHRPPCSLEEPFNITCTVLRALCAINLWTYRSRCDRNDAACVSSCPTMNMRLHLCVCVKSCSLCVQRAGPELFVCVCDVPSGCELACGVKAMLHAETDLWSTVSKRRIMLNYSSPLSHYLHWLLHSSSSPSPLVPSSLHPSHTAPASLSAFLSPHSSLGLSRPHLISLEAILPFLFLCKEVQQCREYSTGLWINSSTNKMLICFQ